MERQKSPMVELVAVICGIFMVITVMFLIFSRENLEELVPISWSFMILGIVVAVFQYKLVKDISGVKKK